MLGKRLENWYTHNTADIGNNIEKLFEILEKDPKYINGISKDDFALAMENVKSAPNAINGWLYSYPRRNDGLTQLKINPLVPNPHN